MAEHFDDPPPSPEGPPPEPQPGAAGGPHGDDLPADFFNDEPRDAVSPEPLATLGADEPVLAHTEAPAFAPVPPPPPEVEPGPRGPTFPILLGGLFLIVLAVAAVVERQPKAETPATPPATTAPPAATAAAPAPAPSDAHAETLKGLRAEVDGLSKQVKEFQSKVDALPKAEPAPDLKPIQGKLDELTKAVEAVGPLPEKVSKLDERVGGLDEGLKSVRGEVSELKGEVAKAGEASRSGSGASRPAADAASAPADDAAYAQGADQFKAGKYKEASETFRKLAAGDPKDARVFYFAALARGASTNDWRGETERLVNQGVALEKAGNPKGSEIDSALSGLPDALKSWLDYYRKKAR